MDLDCLDLDTWDWYGLGEEINPEVEDGKAFKPDPGIDSVLVCISALLLVWFFTSLFWASIWGKEFIVAILP